MGPRQVRGKGARARSEWRGPRDYTQRVEYGLVLRLYACDGGADEMVAAADDFDGSTPPDEQRHSPGVGSACSILCRLSGWKHGRHVAQRWLRTVDHQGKVGEAICLALTSIAVVFRALQSLHIA